MNNEVFGKVLSGRLQRIRETLAGKADEYARGDRLSNFKKIARFRDVTPEDALMGLVMKHIAALDDFVADLGRDIHQPLSRWDEKIGDIMCYMVLLEALIEERANLHPPTTTGERS